MTYPNYVKVNDKKYKINTDFRVAIECDKIARDTSIQDEERALAIIYKLFGDDGLKDYNNYEKLLELGQKYLACGKELKSKGNSKPDMDYIQDEGYIRSSFKYDYKYDPYEMEYMHWYEYFNDLNNLSNSELGTCCILNRVRNLRNMDLNEIKDSKQRQKIFEAKEIVALKTEKQERHFTQKQEEARNKFIKLAGLDERS